MCGRFAQYRSRKDYLEMLGLESLAGGLSPEPIERYNVAPQSSVAIVRMIERQVRFEHVKWGYAPFWAKGRRRAIPGPAFPDNLFCCGIARTVRTSHHSPLGLVFDKLGEEADR